MAKVCVKCSTSKAQSEFEPDGRTADGLSNRCLPCLTEHRSSLKEANKKRASKRALAWRKANPEAWKAIEVKSKSKNRDKVLLRMRNNYAENAESRRQSMREYYAQNKDKILEIRRSSPNSRMSATLRSRINCALKRVKAGKQKPGSAVKDLGCSVGELMSHLESLFKPGMSWHNHGLKGWHIDHIIPLDNFDLTDPEQFKKACHYKNLQPLWAVENLSKGARLGQG